MVTSTVTVQQLFTVELSWTEGAKVLLYPFVLLYMIFHIFLGKGNSTEIAHSVVFTANSSEFSCVFFFVMHSIHNPRR